MGIKSCPLLNQRDCMEAQCALWFNEGKDKEGLPQGCCSILRLAIDIQSLPYDLRQMLINR